MNLVTYLIDHSYIIKYEKKKTFSERMEEQEEILKIGYKKEANLYCLTPKLRDLNHIAINDLSFTLFIDKHTHLLNDNYFNHYYYNYRNIQIELPSELRSHLTFEARDILDRWGDQTIKEYHNTEFGYDDNNWAGTHFNAFVRFNKQLSNFNTPETVPFVRELLKHTSLGEVSEIGIAQCWPLLVADQLIKTYGDNDFSDFFKKNKFKKKVIVQKVKVKEKHNKKRVRKTKQTTYEFSLIDEIDILEKLLIDSPNVLETNVYETNPLFGESNDDYIIFNKIFPQQLYTALFGFQHIKEFKEHFPEAIKILYEIKRGRYLKFTSNLKMKIFKNDKRLHLKEDAQAFKKGQSYYKIV
ncbi:MAG: hypothetical protein HZB98_13545, partial [Bacteroidia bacterium]|nr:hypothetical protein [Bacteroidia bacterium]